MYLDNYIHKIQSLCKTNNVKHLFAFGSVLTADFRSDSDIDFLVDFMSQDPFDYAESYFNLKFRLEELLNRPIDLLEEKGLKNSYLIQNINNNKSIIYEA
ncbi:MAG: nucleotidyltransferase domain-containing protein [Bacteroidales bacterium]|nr:nucleotidyltransferase domain-containing protein [Bacteroidales bacterium]MBN2820999.1 nucleotidyltransferase domain-containing protein [Bacteroidales bacterium]